MLHGASVFTYMTGSFRGRLGDQYPCTMEHPGLSRRNHRRGSPKLWCSRRPLLSVEKKQRQWPWRFANHGLFGIQYIYDILWLSGYSTTERKGPQAYSDGTSWCCGADLTNIPTKIDLPSLKRTVRPCHFIGVGTLLLMLSVSHRLVLGMVSHTA